MLETYNDSIYVPPIVGYQSFSMISSRSCQVRMRLVRLLTFWMTLTTWMNCARILQITVSKYSF